MASKVKAKMRNKSLNEGVTLPAFSDDFSIRTKRKLKVASPRVRTVNGTIIDEVARALDRPGIPPASVFTANSVNSYSVYLADPTKVVRKTFDGKRAVGRIVRGKFRRT